MFPSCTHREPSASFAASGVKTQAEESMLCRENYSRRMCVVPTKYGPLKRRRSLRNFGDPYSRTPNSARRWVYR